MFVLICIELRTWLVTCQLFSFTVGLRKSRSNFVQSIEAFRSGFDSVIRRCCV